MKSKGIFTRALCALLCTIMIIGMVPVTVAAEGEEVTPAVVLDVADVTLTLGNSAVDGYYTVDVPVEVTTNGGLNSIRFDVTYDVGLTLAGWAEGTVLPAADNTTGKTTEELAKKPFTVVYGDVNATEGNENATNSTATGTLITLQFKVADTVAAGTTFNISLDNIFACYQPAKEENGFVPAPVDTTATATATAGSVTTQPKSIVYDASDITYVGIADAKGLKNKWTSHYDYERGLWVVNFTEDIDKKKEDYLICDENGDPILNKDGNKQYNTDGDRIQVKFPTIDPDIDLPFVVLGIRVPTTKSSWDFNVYYNGGTGDSGDRTWSAKDCGSAIGKTKIGKQIFDMSNDSKNYGVNSIYAVASNAWDQSAFTAPAGENAFVQYIAFFKTLEEAQAFEYVDPHTEEAMVSDGDEATATDMVVFDGEDLDAFTSAGTLKSDATGKYLSIGKTTTFDIKPTTDRIPASGADSWFDYRYHVFVYKATGIKDDGFAPRAFIDGEDVFTFGDQDLTNTDGELDYYIFDLATFTDGVGTPVTNVWENPYFRISQCDVDGAQLDIYAIASFRTLEQVEAFKHLYIREELHNDTASIALADGTASILTGETKSFTYELTGRNDGLPVVSDATIESVVYSIDNENATITADGEIKGVAVGTAYVTATFTLTSGDTFTATTAVEIKPNPKPAVLYEGNDLILAGEGGGLIGKVVYAYDKATGLVTATLPEFTGADGNRFKIKFDGVSPETPYIAYGIRISNTPKQDDNTYPSVTIKGNSKRLWGSTAKEDGFGNTQVYSTTEIKKHVLDLTTFMKGESVGKDDEGNNIPANWSMVTEADVINGIAINAWKGKGTIPAGTVIDVQYVAFFNNFEDAKKYTYIAPKPRTITFMVNGNVYATQTVVEGETFDYPETTPAIPGKVFVGWDAEEDVVTGDLTVNAIFSAPKIYDYNSSELTVLANAEVSLTKVEASATDSPYFRFTAGIDLPYGKDQTTGARDDNSYAQIRFSDIDNEAIAANDVLVIYYRSNLGSITADLTPGFQNGRIWGGNTGTFNGDEQWHKYVLDLSEAGFNGGEGGMGDNKTWEKAIASNTFKLIQFRPFYTLAQIKQEGGYFDIKYVGLFDSVEAANAYEYVEPSYHEVKFVADGKVYETKYIGDGGTIIYPSGEPTPPSGYKFVKWNVPATAVITGDLTVNAVFALGSSATAETIIYGKNMTIELGEIYGSNGLSYSDTTAIARAYHEGNYDIWWDNNGTNSLVTTSGYTIPTTHKYYVIGMTTYVADGNVASNIDNVRFYAKGTSLGYASVDLKSHAGTDLYAHVINLENIIPSGNGVDKIVFEPIPNNLASSNNSGDSTRFGTNGHFRLGFIAAFKTLEDAEAYAATYNTVAENVEVTVTATEGGSVIGTGGQYAVGSRLILTAVPAEGYVLDGWYLNAAEEAVSTDTTFTHTVSAATTIEARFVKAIKKIYAKLGVIGPESQKLGNFEKTGGAELVADGYTTSGEAVKYTATATNEGVFGYWRRFVSTSGLSVYLGMNATIDAYALGVDWQYQPVFFAKAAEGEQQVQQTIYVDATNLILSYNDKPTTNPTKPGYTFKNWKVREENDVVKVMEPVYTINDSTTSTLTVYAANGVATSYAPSFNEVVTLDAGADNVVWTLKIGNKSYPVSYNREYSFRYRITAASATLTATVTSDAPKALVSGIEAVHADAATRFIGSYYVPENYTVTGYGMLLTSNEAVADNMNLDTKDKNVIVGNLATANNEDSMMFVVNKNNTLNDGKRTTWYGRAFLMYTDGTTSHVIYGDTISK